MSEPNNFSPVELHQCSLSGQADGRCHYCNSVISIFVIQNKEQSSEWAALQGDINIKYTTIPLIFNFPVPLEQKYK